MLQLEALQSMYPGDGEFVMAEADAEAVSILKELGESPTASSGEGFQEVLLLFTQRILQGTLERMLCMLVVSLMSRVRMWCPLAQNQGNRIVAYERYSRTQTDFN